MKAFVKIIVSFLLIALVSPAFAHVKPGVKSGKKGKKQAEFRMDCAQATKQRDLAINNVRARLLNGGDVFWDLDDGRYIVPKVEVGSGVDEVSSIFAAAVWIGGIDTITGNLKMAAQDYRSSTSNDFFPGPLRDEDGTTDPERCLEWDKMFNVTGEEIGDHLENLELLGDAYTINQVPAGVRYWPALGNENFFDRYEFDLPSAIQGLGNFYDDNGDGLYDPLDGDYPVIDIRGCPDPQYPDDMWFWIYNDAGGTHTNTNAEQMRMEIQIQAFAYATQDEVNNMTFQRYKLINRAAITLDSTYFAMWVDPDLGCSEDDYIGCDTATSLMYVYNQDPLDGQGSTCDCEVGGQIIPTYCNDVPVLGVDYFRGPISEPRLQPDGSFRPVELGMSSFTYYLRGGQGFPDGMTDPTEANEFYNYITGRWKDGTPFTAGGSGYNPGSPAPAIPYAFPNNPNDPNGWSMCTANQNQGDRRTIQASGPFKLQPGRINELIVGVVWVPSIVYPCPDIEPLVRADQKAQGLFDACFDIVDGPDAPTLCALELDQEIAFSMVNVEGVSNNHGLNYFEQDPKLSDVPDSLYVFEGYKIYQLVDASASASDVGDESKIKLILQYDVKNSVKEIYNWSAIDDPFSVDGIWVPTKMVEGQDEGVSHSFTITEDQFASGDTRLINFKKYYFTVIAYGYNNFRQFDAQNPLAGQNESYIEGRRNVKRYTVVPHPTHHVNLQSFYGDSDIEVIGLDGDGVGERFANISDETREEIVLNGGLDEIPYSPGQGPIGVKIYDPVNIKDGEYILEFQDYDSIPLEDALFTVRDAETNESFLSEVPVDKINEHLINNFGFSVTIGNGEAPGENTLGTNETNGFIGFELEYKDPTGPEWMEPIRDNAFAITNFMRTDGEMDRDYLIDPNQVYSETNQSGFYPFMLTTYDASIDSAGQGPMFEFTLSPTWMDDRSIQLREDVGLSTLNNVDIVFTKDKRLWSRCPVVQSAAPEYENVVGDRTKSMDLVTHPGVDKYDMDGDGEADLLADPADTMQGFSWFPGYAVNVVTGERMNLFFGENTTFSKGNIFGAPDSIMVGGDAMFNPNGLNTIAPIGPGQPFSVDPDFWIVGGQHTIYVTNLPYDGGAYIHSELLKNLNKPQSIDWITKRKLFKHVTWSTMLISTTPFTPLGAGEEGLIPNDLTIKLRVNQDYNKFEIGGTNNGFNSYKFKIAGKESLDLTTEEVESALDEIAVVPNPYYAYSVYENNSAQNIVKITNLPAKCNISIYSLDGKFIRQYKRDEAVISKTAANAPLPNELLGTDLEWDMKNNVGVPISSGVYYIHIQAPGLGERVVKWFGINRAFDPSGL